ncbi:MAG: choice-of-anchor E domain-containing protein [Bryobacteraceae bacterium]
MTKTLLALAALSAASLTAATQTFSVTTNPNGYNPGPTVSYDTLAVFNSVPGGSCAAVGALGVTATCLPGFDNQGGTRTLTGVNLFIETQMNQGGTWRNDGGSPATYGYGYIGIGGAPAAQILVNGLGLGAAFIQNGTAAFTNFRSDLQNPGGVGSFSTVQEFADNGGGPLGPAVPLAGFDNGGALIPYQVLAQAGFLSTCTNGNCFSDIQTRMGARITVQYTYTVDETGVPEPSTNVLMGAGLLVIGLVSRKFVR